MKRPLRFINAAELHPLTERCDEILYTWNKRYALNPIRLQIQSTAIKKNYAKDIYTEKTCLARMEDSYLAFFKQVLFGNTHVCFNEATEELMFLFFQQLFQIDACTIKNTDQEKRLWDYLGSPCIYLTLKSHQTELYMSISPDWVYQRLPQIKTSPQPLCSLEEALIKQDLKAYVMLSPFSLSLRQLAHLKRGDILCTNHPLSLPLKLMHQQQELSPVALGKSNFYKSILIKESL